MSIDQSTAAKVAKLARIKVEEDALPALAEEFNTILGFIEQLNEVDVEGVDPTAATNSLAHLSRTHSSLGQMLYKPSPRMKVNFADWAAAHITNVLAYKTLQAVLGPPVCR